MLPERGMSVSRWSRSSGRFSAVPGSAVTWWFRGMGELALYRDRRHPEPTLRSGKSLALLAYVALSPRRRAPRQHLAELLWPDLPRPSQHHALRQCIYRLRHAAPDAPLVRSRGQELEELPGIRFDFREGEIALGAGRYEDAEKLLRGDFFDGFSVPEAREFERWVESRRVGLRSSWARAARTLAEERLAQADLPAAIEIAEALLAQRPFDEDALRLLMTGLAGEGRYALAVARFRSFARLLREELGGEPSEELRRYVGELDRCAGATSLRPNRDTRFVGRSGEWAVLEETWRGAPEWDGALVLLQGGEGAGKSRLLKEFAERARAGGARVLSARCSPAAGQVPYGSVVPALRQAARLPGLDRLSPRRLAQVARLLPEIRDAFPNLPEPEPGPDGWLAASDLFEAVSSWLRELTRESGLLVTIDDLQVADAESLELIHFLTRGQRDSKALIVAACRPHEFDPAGRRFLGSIVSGRLVRLIFLGGPSQETASFPTREPGSQRPDTDESIAAYVDFFSGGNPSLRDSFLNAVWTPVRESSRNPPWPLRREGDVEALRRTIEALSTQDDPGDLEAEDPV
jgi:DNA-binding SARP family transcriptional activator